MLEMQVQIPVGAVTRYRVELAIPAGVPTLWSAMLPILEERGKRFLQVYSEEEIFRLSCQGVIDVWLGTRGDLLDGFALCAWEVHARAKYYHVLGIFGDNLEYYLDQGLERMEKYSMILGASEMVLEGRRGWQRLLAKRGYKPRTVRLRKDVRKAWGN